MVRLQNFIGGEFHDPVSGGYMGDVNPATLETLAEVPDSDILDVVRALQAAHKAQAEWAKWSPERRADLLLRLADQMAVHAEELARWESEDQGMPLAQAREIEVPLAQEVMRFYARALLHEVSRARTEGGKFLHYSHRQPAGVVALILPSAQPLLSLASRLAPALACGNVIVAKPSHRTPRTAFLLARLFAEVGAPGGVFNLVLGRGENVGDALVSHPGLPVLAFAGRTATGRRVLNGAAEFLKRTHLSMGARNAVLVFAESDFEKSMPRILQLSLDVHLNPHLRGSRFFVQESVYDRFLESFKKQLDQTVIGDPLDGKTNLGPLVDERAKAAYEAALNQARKENGKELASSSSTPETGSFARPTAFYDLTLCSTLQQEDIPGPLITIASFKYQHDAIKKANTSPLGQAAYVWHGDVSKAHKVAQQIEAGRVFINTGPVTDFSLPYEGMKESGLGLEGAEAWLAFFSRNSRITLGL